MPRSPASRADRELIAALADRGLRVSPYQLERWRTTGLLPRNNRRGLGRGQGSVSELADTAVDLAATLATQARQGRATRGGHVIERFARGQRIDETRVRAAFRAQLDRIARKLAMDAEDGDRGWQARYDAANRLARSAAIVSWENLIDAINDVSQDLHVTLDRTRFGGHPSGY